MEADPLWQDVHSPVLYRVHGVVLHGIPEVLYPLVTLPPAPHDVRQLVLRQAHGQRSHADQRPGAPLVPKGQLCHFPFAPQRILRIPLFDLFDRDPEHSTGGGLVDPPMRPEHIQPPILPGKPRQHAGLYGGEIGHDEAAPLPRYESGPDQLREQVRHVPVHGPYRIRLPRLHQEPCRVQAFDVVAREVLHLYEPTCEPARPAGPVELQQPADPAVPADTGPHGFVFLHGRLSQLFPDLQHFFHQLLSVLVRQYPGHSGLVQALQLHP